MYRFFTILAVTAAVFLESDPVDAGSAKPSTVKASWAIMGPATTTSPSFNDRGSIAVHLESSKLCNERFRIEQLHFVQDWRDREKIARALTGKGAFTTLDVTLRKLFPCRGRAPQIAIGQNGKRSQYTFENTIDVDEWPRQGYRIVGQINVDDMAMPKFWRYVVLTCE